jgi:hypothetical protein
MMKVSSQSLSPDGTTADTPYGIIDRGDMDAQALTALLEKFAALDAVQNHEHDPHLIVRTRDSKYLIRTSGGQLHLYNARDTSQPAAVLSLPRLLEILAGPAVTAGAASDEPELLTPAPAGTKHRGVLAASLLILAVGLNAWGISQFLNQEEDPPPPAYTEITNPEQLNALRHQLAGSYATGREPGDRIITIASDGTIRFQLLAARAGGTSVPANAVDDTYAVGRRSGGLNCLVTAVSGQVEIGVDGTLRYYGDTYRRTEPPAK